MEDPVQTPAARQQKRRSQAKASTHGCSREERLPKTKAPITHRTVSLYTGCGMSASSYLYRSLAQAPKTNESTLGSASIRGPNEHPQKRG